MINRMIDEQTLNDLQYAGFPGLIITDEVMIDVEKNASINIKILNTFIKPYQSRLKERAFVEDEINDFILVDKDYIEAYMLIHNKWGYKMDFILLFILALGTVCSIANINKSNDFLSRLFNVLVSCILLLTTIGTFVRIIITALGV